MARARAILAALILSCGAPACARAPQESRALRELEGLAFLPRGEYTLDVPTARTFRLPAPVLIGRFEVTRAEWRAYLDQAKPAVGAQLVERVRAWEPGTEAWPASYMTREEAEAYAAWRGMRLPTLDEWLFAALGPSRWPFPWGTTFRKSVANTLELGLGRPTPVGTFEAGRTPGGCYDLLGNVAEWIADSAPSADRDAGDRRGSALGGSFRTYTWHLGRQIYDARAARALPLAFDLEPGSRLDHVGLRCAVDAEPYLWARAPEWGEDPAARSRIAAVGERFGRSALPLLAELAARPGAPAALAFLVEGARR